MKVKELIRMLQAVDGDLEVVTHGFDHSYEHVNFGGPVYTEVWPNGFICQYWDDVSLSEGVVKGEAFLIE